MSYTPPAGNAANFSWVGVAAYTPPAGNAANFSWTPTGFTVTGAGTLSFTGAGTVAHGVEVTGAGTIPFTGAGTVEHGIATATVTGAGTLAFTGEGSAAHGVAVTGAGVLDFTGAGASAHGVAVTGAGALSFAGSGVMQHLRYEVRGEVRIGGALVERRVRCYRRDTGELISQGDTVAGKFRLHTGFDTAEVYVTPIHLDAAATDWLPPTANRLVPVLADDTA